EVGLSEIKSEIRAIESLVFSTGVGLSEIKSEIRAIESLVFSTEVGLSEIKSELRAIESLVFSTEVGLSEIKSELRAIESLVFSTEVGLSEIKSEIRAIESLVFSTEVGLSEIKSEIRAIESLVFSTLVGLSEIKTEIFDIINNPSYGLIEIKSEIRALELANGLVSDLTTGPVLRDVNTQDIEVKILNNNTITLPVATVLLRDIETCPAITVATAVFNDLGPKCGTFVIFTESVMPTGLGEFEVQLYGIGTGIYAWVSGRNPVGGGMGRGVQVVGANTFRHSELAPLIDP
ncbi:MAG: hypothetical protein N2484_05870, partial [Clostridia bacterium]|nr:hypothetical protein [Clostridia bacterium]